MIRGGLLILVSFFIITASSAQVSEDYNYNVDITWGLLKTTNSGILAGGFYRYSTRLENDLFRSFGLELVNIKHPKEQRYATIYGNAFIAGKANYLYVLRTQYGYSFPVFKKAPQQGVQVDFVVLAGPSFGLVTPYHVLIDRGAGSVSEPYDPSQNYESQIVGSSGFLKGVGDMSLAMGLHAKVALQFEFGTTKSNVSGFETGFMAEVFSREIPILPEAINYQFYPAAYISIFYGKRK